MIQSFRRSTARPLAWLRSSCPSMCRSGARGSLPDLASAARVAGSGIVRRLSLAVPGFRSHDQVESVKSTESLRDWLSSACFRLVLTSFLVLFLELTLIRWLSAYVLYLGYFTNFILLGALLGIGTGSLLANRSQRLIQRLPPLLFFLVVLALVSRTQLDPDLEGHIYFTSTQYALRLPAWVILPLIFVIVSACFVMPGQELGALFNEFEPLRAYSLNILGSLAGISCFTLLSFASAQSWVWFLAVAILIVPLLTRGRSRGRNLLLLSGTVLVVAVSDLSFANLWSPYSRLNLIERRETSARRVRVPREEPQAATYILLANGIWHQEFYPIESSRPFYSLPYEVLGEANPPGSILVVGSGGGNDVAEALAFGAQRVDAVEIDGRIAELGFRYHPERPYQSPRVELHLEDGRAFLNTSDQRYDMIVFALPDSLVLASSMSNLRLESFLFTREAFLSVKDHLKPDGLFVLYNYYRSEWLVDKIALMLWEGFGERPLYHTYPDPEFQQLVFATFFAGPGTRNLDPGRHELDLREIRAVSPSTDDWPFLYMQKPSLPIQYTGALGLILLLSTLYVGRFSSGRELLREGKPYFFMGAAFMLLEARSIVQFFLLFGSTWLVNSLVFFAILLAVLLANWVVARFRIARLEILYGLLFGALALNFALPPERLLLSNLILRYLTSSALLFSPIFLANLIYGSLFRATRQANIAFGANLLGTMVGGSLEYLALLLGYRNLVALAGLLYAVVFLLSGRLSTRGQPMVEEGE